MCFLILKLNQIKLRKVYFNRIFYYLLMLISTKVSKLHIYEGLFTMAYEKKHIDKADKAGRGTGPANHRTGQSKGRRAGRAARQKTD